jgi:hypothetical protein
MSVAVYNHFEFVGSTTAAVLTASEQVSNTGEVRQVVVVVPSISGTVTITVTDENGVTLFTSGALGSGTKNVFWPYTSGVSGAGMPFCVSSGGDKTCNVNITFSQSNPNAIVQVNMFIKA